MGAWGTGIFDNDEAMDWLGSWAEADEGEGTADDPGRIAFVIGAMAVAIDHKGYMDADIGECALAAAEAVAAANGKPCPAVAKAKDTDGDLKLLKEWSASPRAAILKDKDVQTLAIQAIDRSLKGESEIAELWADSEDKGADWLKSVNDLRSRLSGKA